MRQRLGLATALLGDPEVLILDEPANGLDPEGIRWLRELLRRLAAEGRTVLVASHILAEVAQTVDSVVIVDHGQLMAQSSLDELTARTDTIVRVTSPRANELRLALKADGARPQLVARDELRVTAASAERVGTLAAELSIPIFECATEPVSLEDVFFPADRRQPVRGPPMIGAIRTEVLKLRTTRLPWGPSRRHRRAHWGPLGVVRFERRWHGTHGNPVPRHPCRSAPGDGRPRRAVLAHDRSGHHRR